MARHLPSVKIIEQPQKTYRFRYQSEIGNKRNRNLSSIKGASSSEAIRTYPAIQVHGYEGPMLVRLSLVNARNGLVHPHSLKSTNKKYLCSNGIISFFSDKSKIEFRDLGIVCVRGKSMDDIKKALETRRDYDPLGAGFSHVNNHRLIDLSAVRLSFQVFLPSKNCTQADLHVPETYDVPLPAVTSSVIYDEKKYADLKIVYFAGPLVEGREMQLWCNKYTGADPDVVFADGAGWSEKAYNVLTHQRVAMRFEPPRYKQPETTCAAIKVEVRLQQIQQSGQPLRSNPVYVEYTWRVPRLTSPSYLSNKDTKNIDEKIEVCRALVDRARTKSWEPTYEIPSTSRASESSDQVRPDSGFLSPANDVDSDGSTVHSINQPNTDHLMSTNDLEYGSSVDLIDFSCEVSKPLNIEQEKCILEFDDSLL